MRRVGFTVVLLSLVAALASIALADDPATGCPVGCLVCDGNVCTQCYEANGFVFDLTMKTCTNLCPYQEGQRNDRTQTPQRCICDFGSGWVLSQDGTYCVSENPNPLVCDEANGYLLDITGTQCVHDWCVGPCPRGQVPDRSVEPHRCVVSGCAVGCLACDPNRPEICLKCNEQIGYVFDLTMKYCVNWCVPTDGQRNNRSAVPQRCICDEGRGYHLDEFGTGCTGQVCPAGKTFDGTRCLYNHCDNPLNRNGNMNAYSCGPQSACSCFSDAEGGNVCTRENAAAPTSVCRDCASDTDCADINGYCATNVLGCGATNNRFCIPKDLSCLYTPV